MGVLDKIKNALFEVEYVEVEEPEKKDKKKKIREKENTNSEKPIAKKIVLPGKREEKVEELEEEELKDENFETRPKDETVKESSHDEFKFMDDDDFKVDGHQYEATEEPEILEVIDQDDEKFTHKEKNDFRRESRQTREEKNSKTRDDYEYVADHPDKYYNNPAKSYSAEKERKPYGLDKSYKVPMHEYGAYERKDEKVDFKPSPIISPIYGILDKNYKKEDVVQKKEIRLTTNVTRSNVSVDDIRNKAYGEHSNEANLDHDITTFEVDDDEDDNLLVDLSDDNGKPEVKEVTMGDALEYFQDLGLEYNVDYVDATKERTTPRRVKDNYDDVDVPVVKEPKEEKKTSPVVEVKDESNEKKDVSLDDDDNLFDLIDSMYQDN